MKTLGAVTVLFSALMMGLVGCASEDSPESSETRDPLGGAQASATAHPQPSPVPTVASTANSSSGGSPTPTAQDPCTQKFGKDQKLCESVAPKCEFDAKQGICVLGGGQGGGTAGSTTVDAADVVTAYCMKMYGNDQKACSQDPKCAFDSARQICRAK